jgi:arabinose-5-phosphate isomerase
MPDADIEYARKVIALEARTLSNLVERVNSSVKAAIKLILACKGRVVLTGMGKAGIVGQKISATLASTGTPSYFLHPAEAVHGDLGRIVDRDVVIALSNMGETQEITRLLPSIKKIGAKIIAITGNARSVLAKHSDVVIDMGRIEEACPLGLAPSASTTAMLAMGDALALTVLKNRRFSKEDYAFYHPGGGLGRRLMVVEDIMRTGRENAVVTPAHTVRQALRAIRGVGKVSKRRTGCACVVDSSKRLTGIFTDGDLRRHLDTGHAFLDRPIEAVMTRNPKVVKKGSLVTEAYKTLKDFRIDEIPVVDGKGRFVGLIDVQDLLETTML